LLASLLFQANIALPNTPARPKQDCRSTPTVLPDGTRQFKDCSGATAIIERKPLSRTDKPAPAAPESAGITADKDAVKKTANKEQDALQAQHDYEVYSYTHAERTFDWQYWSGKIIFWVVLFMVGAGVFFSALQFYLGLRHPRIQGRDTKQGASLALPDLEASEFEATLHGIKLKSSVLGLVILAMSMVFFYLYLRYVYPVKGVSR
jgi:hypothetical protein